MSLTALDDAAWASPWRTRATGDKAVLSLGLTLSALLAPPLPGGLLVAAAALGVLVGPARVPARLVAATLAAPLLFVLVGALSVAVAVGESAPDAWWAAGPFSLGQASLSRAGALLVHGVAGAAGVLVLATTTPMVDLIAAGRRLRIPDPVLEVAALTYRLLFVLLETTGSVLAAQQARLGGSPRRRTRRSALAARWEIAGSAVGTVLLRSWDRARRLSAGLAGRGYDDALVTLAADRRSSPRFLLATAALLLAVWAAVVAWAAMVGWLTALGGMR